MATLFDISLLEGGSTFFAFIMILVISYALLTSTSFLKLSKFNATVAAVCFGMLTLFTPPLLNAIKIIIPWSGIIIAFVVFILVALFTLGYTQDDLAKTISSKDYGMQIKVWIIVIGAILFIAALASQFAIFGGGAEDTQVTNQNSQQTQNGEATVTSSSSSRIDESAIATKGEDALVATLFHPKMLGMIALMLIAVFASIFLATSTK